MRWQEIPRGKGRREPESEDEEQNGMEVDGEEDHCDARATASTSASSSSRRDRDTGRSRAFAAASQNGHENRDMEEDEDRVEQDQQGRPSQSARTATEAGAARDAPKENGTYDPNQDADEKRQIRKDYRDLAHELMSKRARDPDGISTTTLMDGLSRVNALFDKVKTPAEAVLDSSVLTMTSDSVYHTARKLKIGGDYFDTEDFLSKLKTVITGGASTDGRRASNSQGTQRGRGRKDNGSEEEEEDELDEEYAPPSDQSLFLGWDKLGKLATRHTLRIPPIDFMLGPLAIPQKKVIVKERKAREKKDTRAADNPKELTRDDIELDDQETTKLVRFIAEVLEEAGGEEGINLFEFIMNPESYGQTVENLFYLSFLVREGKATLTVHNGEAIVYMNGPKEEEDMDEEGPKAHQVIIELDMKMWKEAIESYDIKESVIPTRQVRARQAGKWYA